MYPVAMPIEAKQMGDGVAVVTVAGRLVLGKEIEQLETTVTGLLGRGSRKFVFDLGKLDYADSSGVGTFVACLTSIRKAGGEMRMAGVNSRILRLFQITGVDHLMTVYPTVAEAAAG